MKKIKIEFPSNDFGTLNTKYPAHSDRVDNDDFTAGTTNVETSVKGVITKRKGSTSYTTLPNPPRDQYEAIFSDGVRHLLTIGNGELRYSSGDGNNTQVLTGLTANLNFEFATTQDRVYYGNGIQKKVYDRTTSYGGVAYTFPTQTNKDLGAQAPSSAPTSNTPTAGGSVPDGSHTYRVTFLYYGAEESNGSPASGVQTCGSGNNTVPLTSIPIGGYGVTARKIYRDDNDGVYTFIGTISDNTTTTFNDTISSGLTPLPTDQGLPPDFTQITLYLDRLFLAGVPGDPYTIYYSEPGLPDIYPALNTLDCNQEDPITAIVVFLDRLVVFNRRSMGQVLGTTSDQFRYASIQSSVGCVDNRTLQTRVIDGVPVLIWLSDKGFYAYDGNSVVYISDAIEDQINSNISQAVIQKNQITHSDQGDFQDGTSTDGINLDTYPGTITTKGPYWDTGAHPLATEEEQTNPKKVFDSQSEWKDGTTLTNLALEDQQVLAVPTRFSPEFSAGTLSGDVVASTTTLQIATVSDETLPGISFVAPNEWAPALNVVGTTTNVPVRFAIRRTVTNPGIITSVTGYFYRAPASYTGRIALYSDATTEPGTLLVSQDFTIASGPTFTVESKVASFSQAVSGPFWVVIEYLTSPGFQLYFPTNITGTSYNVKYYKDGSWVTPVVSYPSSGTTQSFPHGITYVQTPIAASGSYTSEIYDTKSIYVSSGVSIQNSLINSGVGTLTTIVEASDDPIFSGGAELSETIVNLNGTQVLGISGKRYWRIKHSLATTDRQFAEPRLTAKSILKFNTAAVWESEVIDTTSDSTTYDTLSTVATVPAGTSVTTQIATSASPSGPWTYVTFGSHAVLQYVKFRITLNTDTTNETTPSVTSLTFEYSQAPTFISDTIDTGTTPAGWDIFQSSFSENGGTVLYYMRSAASEAGLTGATWYAVLNGTFPSASLPVLQWVQWKAEITSSTDNVPEIFSTTIGWFLGSSSEITRAASIFHDRNYYVALAELEQPANNVIYVLDQFNKWRKFTGLTIATLSYFFNNPYYGDAVSGKILKFLQGTNDDGNPIELDVRTKAFDGSTQFVDYDDKIKVLDHAILACKNTGASYSVSYSVDDGNTFYPLHDTSGNSTWSTSTDGLEKFTYLRPGYTNLIPRGRTVLFRIYNNDINEVEITNIKAMAFVREQPPIITG